MNVSSSTTTYSGVFKTNLSTENRAYTGLIAGITMQSVLLPCHRVVRYYNVGIGKMHSKNTYNLVFCVFISFNLVRWESVENVPALYRLVYVTICVIVCDCVHNGIAFVAMLPQRWRAHCKRSYLGLRVWESTRNICQQYGTSNVIYGQNENKPKRRKSVDELRSTWTDVQYLIRAYCPLFGLHSTIKFISWIEIHDRKVN